MHWWILALAIVVGLLLGTLELKKCGFVLSFGCFVWFWRVLLRSGYVMSHMSTYVLGQESALNGASGDWLTVILSSLLFAGICVLLPELGIVQRVFAPIGGLIMEASEPAWNSFRPRRVQKALKEIKETTDQEKLIRIARETVNPTISKAVIDQTEDEDMLFEIAKPGGPFGMVIGKIHSVERIRELLRLTEAADDADLLKEVSIQCLREILNEMEGTDMLDLVFLKELMTRVDFPEEAQEFFLDLAGKIKGSAWMPRYKEGVDLLAPCADLDANRETMAQGLAVLEALACEMELSPYSLHLLALMDRYQPLLAEYRAQGIPEEIFENTARDLHWKLNECREVYGVWGTFVASWFIHALRMGLFAIGRFHYQPAETKEELRFPDGRVVPAGSFCLRIHIPSGGGPITDEVRRDSYRRAAEFFREQFGDGPKLFACESWLLYPAHREFLPKDLNILRFMDDFTLLTGFDMEEFLDSWRLFGAASLRDMSEWPRNTALQRAYLDRLQSGGKSGKGDGYFLWEEKDC